MQMSLFTEDPYSIPMKLFLRDDLFATNNPKYKSNNGLKEIILYESYEKSQEHQQLAKAYFRFNYNKILDDASTSIDVIKKYI